VIDPKALELGRLLGQTDEYKAFLRASERLREEAACRQQLAEVERLAQEIEPRRGASRRARRSSSTTARSKASRRIRCIRQWWRLRRTSRS